jgi:hypothetical protein
MPVARSTLIEPCLSSPAARPFADPVLPAQIGRLKRPGNGYREGKRAGELSDLRA